jgi:hypothetical protein
LFSAFVDEILDILCSQISIDISERRHKSSVGYGSLKSFRNKKLIQNSVKFSFKNTKSDKIIFFDALTKTCRQLAQLITLIAQYKVLK